MKNSVREYNSITFLKKLTLKLKGVSEERIRYNISNDLPLGWRGSKEGFYEKMEVRNNYSGSN